MVVEHLESVRYNKGEVVIGLDVIELKNVTVANRFGMPHRFVSAQHKEKGTIVHMSLRLIIPA